MLVYSCRQDDASYCALLNRLRDASLTAEDCRALLRRVSSALSHDEKERFTEATHLVDKKRVELTLIEIC